MHTNSIFRIVSFYTIELQKSKSDNIIIVYSSVSKHTHTAKIQRDKCSTTTMAVKLSRKMIFPYTFTAKIVQFPFILHFKHHWMFPWLVGATIVVMPVFYKLQEMSNSEANVKKWADKRKIEQERYEHKWDYVEE